MGCFVGCDNCTGTGKYLYPKQSDFPAGCKLVEPTNNDPKTRSWNVNNKAAQGDFTKYNPWRYPGKAPVHDPCGAASGYINPSHDPYGPEIPKGYAPWAKGSEVLPEGRATVWKAGGLADVSWSIAAQHGGGYQYRLCPKKAGVPLTEECFQAHPLAFAGDHHFVRFNDGSVPTFHINATELSTGTLPAGSTWRRNPIPACNCDVGGGCSQGGAGYHKPYEYAPDPISSGVCPTGTMFPAPFKNAAGMVGALTYDPITYSIVDQVKVPDAEGEYVLSWRWDCEETNQVWNSCADIRISSTEPPTPAPSPAPPAPPSPPPKPPKPAGKGCKAMENPTCKAVSPGKCVFTGCKKCHDDTTWNCDECCNGCSLVHDRSKGVAYCSGSKVPDPHRDDLVEFL